MNSRRVTFRLAFVLLAVVLAGPSSARGQMLQSPIDLRLSDSVASLLPALLFDYGSSVPLTVFNNEETVRADLTTLGANALHVGSAIYDLLQFHWHTPSEHLLEGQAFEMEMHLVHRSAMGETAVVGVFIEEGLHHVELDQIFADLPEHGEPDRPVPDFDLRTLLPGDLRSFRYPGSLTTPPFDEDVNWIVLAEPIQFSAAQIEAFRELFPEGNAREIQPLNGRVVLTDLLAVPEPSSLVLLGGAGVALFGVRLLRRRVGA